MTANAFSFDERPLSGSGGRPSVGSSAITCAVCGSTDVHSDAVERAARVTANTRSNDSSTDTGVLQLGECGRCEHRWTWRGEAASGSEARPARITTRPAHRPAEVANAA